MNRHFTALSLVILTILASGCIGGGNNNEGPETEKSIEIHRVDVQPTQLYEGTPLDAEIEVANVGNLDATIDVGENGGNVLTDRCTDIFSLEEPAKDFNVAPESQRIDGNVYRVEPDEGLTIQWQLSQIGEVPLYGKRCDMKFQVPFNYSVSAYKQVQIKSDDNIEGSSLNWESSSGPLTLAIQTLGGTGDEGQDTYVEGDDSTMTMLVQFQNDNKEDFDKGVTDIQERSLWIGMVKSDGSVVFNETFETGPDIECPPAGSTSTTCYRTGETVNRWVSSSGSTDTYCNLNSDQPIRMFEGESRVMVCEFNLDEANFNDPAEVIEIRSSAKYTYIKDAGTRRVEVQTRG